MSNFQLYKKAISASGTTVENEPIIKSDGASSNVMQWLSNNEASNITISEDGSNNLDLVVSAGNVGIGGTPSTNLEVLATNPTLALHSTEHDDGNTNRESHLRWIGEQSGGEVSTLCRIQGCHDGSADDQKGQFIFYTNDGSDGDSPTERIRIDSAGVITATTGTSGDTADIAALAAGSIRLANFGGGSAIPTLVGKSNDSIGLEIVGATNNSNTSGDLVFNVRENDNSDFATTTTTAFKFTRWNVDLVTILRNGLATFANGIKNDPLSSPYQLLNCVESTALADAATAKFGLDTNTGSVVGTANIIIFTDGTDDVQGYRVNFMGRQTGAAAVEQTAVLRTSGITSGIAFTFNNTSGYGELWVENTTGSAVTIRVAYNIFTRGG